MNDDFDDPESVRLTLRDGKHVDILRRLNHGETEDMLARISLYGVGVNRREVRTAKIAAYVLGWNLTKGGQPVPMGPAAGDLPDNVRTDTIRALKADRAVEIHKAIEAHEAADDQTLADLKKNAHYEASRRSDLNLALRTGWDVRAIRRLSVDDHRRLIDLLTAKPGE